MKILCFGSLNIDRVYGVEHFVTPGETISSISYDTHCGGKGLNQSVAAARAGAEVYHAGAVGADGDILLGKLKQSGVDTSLVKKTEGISGHAVIQVDARGQNSIIIHHGANYDIDKTYIDSVLSHFCRGDIIMLQNEISCVGYIIDAAYEKGLDIMFNPSPMDENIIKYPLNKVKCFVLNEIEGRMMTQTEGEEEILRIMTEKYPYSKTILTLGKRGAVYAEGKIRLHHGIYDTEVRDSTGAGDTFTGYFAAGLTQGLQAEEILRRASIASSIAVSRNGAADSIPELGEVLSSGLKYLGE